MNTYSNSNTIIRSLTTEKSSNLQATKIYTFEINKRSTKTDVKHAIKELYGVDVKKVKIIITPMKTRLVKGGNKMVKRPLSKKAILTLKDKKTIDPNKIKEPKAKK
jgi:large subunit ribosomal protein L23